MSISFSVVTASLFIQFQYLLLCCGPYYLELSFVQGPIYVLFFSFFYMHLAK